MGKLETTIILNDKFSKQLENINRAIHSTTRAMSGIQKTQLSSAQLLRYEELKLAQAKERTQQKMQRTIQIQSQINGQMDLMNKKMEFHRMSYDGVFGQLRLWATKIRNILTMYYAIRGVVQGIGKAVNLSDKMTMTDAKYNLVAGGNKKLAGDLKEKTFAAAQRSTTDYLAFGKAVGKLGVLAGDKFKNQDSIVRFVELMNKSFQISGADTSERNAAMLQITQAIASNRLQGDEFRSILENAPMVMDALVKSLGVGHDKLKKMAKQGEITADVLIKAMFDAGTKIEEMYKQLPMTWERHWAKIKNVGVLAFEPIHKQLEKLFNSEKFQAFVNGLCTAMIVLGNLGGWALEKLATGFNKLLEVGAFLLDFLISVGIAIGIVGIALAIVNWETTTFILVTAGLLLGLLTLLVKFPQILLIIAGVIAITQAVAGNMLYFVIFLIALVIFWVYKCSDSWADAFGKIVGVVMQAFALLWNIIYGVLSAVLELVLKFVNTFIDGWEFALNCVSGGFDNFGAACGNLIGQVINWFLQLGKVVTVIVDAIFGTNWTGGLNSLQKSILAWGKNKNGVTLKRYDSKEVLGNIGINRWAYSDAYNFGHTTGSGWVNNISKGLGNIGSKLDDLTKVDLNGQKLNSEALNGINDKLGEGNDYGANTAKNTGETAKNTSSSNDYSYLRDWYWNKGLGNSIGYNIKIEQNNRNNVASGMDIDKIANALIDKFMEGLNVGKEGAKI